MTVSAVAAPLARVELARDARTTLVVPAFLIAVGVMLVGGSLALIIGAIGGPAIVLVAGVGVLLAAIGAWIWLRTRSLRLVVETDYLHLTGIRVDRRYHLARGDLKRVAAAGLSGGELRTRLSTLGLGVGPATLGGGERIEVIRLGATPSVILVPTERGRVAVAPAPASEAILVEALLDAARTRAERPAPRPAPAVTAAAAASAAMPFTAAPAIAASPLAVQPPAPVHEPPPQPRPLTGIERMWLEEKMATERRAAITGARSEQAAASLAGMAALSPGDASASASAQMVSTPWKPAPSPAATPIPVPAATAPSAAATVVTAAGVASAAPADTPSRRLFSGFPRTLTRALPRRRPVRPMAWRISRPPLGAELAVLAAPLVGAGVVWILAAVVTGAIPGTDGLDPIGAALLLCGPIALLAVFLARSRWPRLAGLSSVAAVISLALVARAVIG